MTPDWTPLEIELTTWQAEGLCLPLWWRDDDATQPSPELDQLCDLSQKLALPVHLAVIPRDATPQLATFVERQSELIPIVHGWAHLNNAAPGDKKCEFPSQRPVDEALSDMERGLSRLQDLFGSRLQPIFVPPWNRISPDLLPWMAGAGFVALSTFTPRKSVKAATGLEQINTHLDPIHWKGSRSLVPPDQLITQVTAQLRDRRLKHSDNLEPYGILTHHLVHDDAIWDFTKALITRLMRGPGQAWQFDIRKT